MSTTATPTTACSCPDFGLDRCFCDPNPAPDSTDRRWTWLRYMNKSLWSRWIEFNTSKRMATILERVEEEEEGE
ncbi:uncharacterized protein H6S33_010901 [Morchella sextelata]|uniref:uncharacterized protein n=1 Tax=Morchella sextelata TaxID=1174677 RepID=UPI001D059AAA|nr:uncharacterized protein H6S33_010901 [Morchella sextelata]KAH0611636.1 hypothetical protein H6S33_010901 [Morchella sextelata]